MKRVIVAHGWDGNPEEGWFPWLKDELEARGFDVSVPQLPNPGTPRIGAWVPALAETVGTPDEDTYLVGHSMGCQTIARYLETLPEGQSVGGVMFVAGFFKRLTNLEEDANSQDVGREWLGAKPDLQKVKSRMRKSVALFSDDDKYVPLDNQDDYRDILGSEIIVQDGKGHFSGGEGTKEIPVVLEKLLEISR